MHCAVVSSVLKRGLTSLIHQIQLCSPPSEKKINLCPMKNFHSGKNFYYFSGCRKVGADNHFEKHLTRRARTESLTEKSLGFFFPPQRARQRSSSSSMFRRFFFFFFKATPGNVQRQLWYAAPLRFSLGFVYLWTMSSSLMETPPQKKKKEAAPKHSEGSTVQH